MRRSSLLLTLYIVFYFVYLITGGVVFAAVEAPEENAVRSALVTARRIFLETHPCVSGTSEIVVSEVTVGLLWDMSCVRRHTRPASSATMLYRLQSRILSLDPPMLHRKAAYMEGIPILRVMLNLSPCLIKGIWWSGAIAKHIIHLRTRWWRIFSFIPWPF
jgi:hypothetical protein